MINIVNKTRHIWPPNKKLYIYIEMDTDKILRMSESGDVCMYVHLYIMLKVCVCVLGKSGEQNR